MPEQDLTIQEQMHRQEEIKINKPPMSNREALLIEFEMIAAALEILMAKRIAYSGTDEPFRNFHSVEAFSSKTDARAGLLTRLGDKLARLWGATEGRNVSAVENVLTSDVPDIINYVSIWAGLWCEKTGEPAHPLATQRLRNIIEKLAKEFNLDD